MPSIYPVKFIDSPISKTVTAVMSDSSEVIINDMSYGNYTDPPGYLDFTTDPSVLKPLLTARGTQYRVSLNSQLSS